MATKTFKMTAAGKAELEKELEALKTEGRIDIAEKLIKELMACGLRGIEAYHRKHSPAIVEYFSSMAENLGLIVTGGSDFHAPNIMNGQIILGKNFVPEWIYGMLLDEKKHLDMARD